MQPFTYHFAMLPYYLRLMRYMFHMQDIFSLQDKEQQCVINKIKNPNNVHKRNTKRRKNCTERSRKRKCQRHTPYSLGSLYKAMKAVSLNLVNMNQPAMHSIILFAIENGINLVDRFQNSDL